MAIVVLATILLQLTQIGRQTPPPTGAQPAPSNPQQPAKPSAPASAPQSVSPAPGTGPLRETRRVLDPSYTVVQGDTLGSIAARHGTTVDAVLSINNLADRNVLSTGQRLVLPNQP